MTLLNQIVREHREENFSVKNMTFISWAATIRANPFNTLICRSTGKYVRSHLANLFIILKVIFYSTNNKSILLKDAVQG